MQAIIRKAIIKAIIYIEWKPEVVRVTWQVAPALGGEMKREEEEEWYMVF